MELHGERDDVTIALEHHSTTVSRGIREGWMALNHAERRTLPQTADALSGIRSKKKMPNSWTTCLGIARGGMMTSRLKAGTACLNCPYIFKLNSPVLYCVYFMYIYTIACFFRHYICRFNYVFDVY